MWFLFCVKNCINASLVIVKYVQQAKQLEEKIFIARDAHYTPSVMELELETRLNQLTDHLIQKQSQVKDKLRMCV